MDSQEVGSEAAILQRKRNSSLAERPRAENTAGLKLRAEAVDPFGGGRGASPVQRSRFVRDGGARGSEDVGTSSDNGGENPPRRKPKGSRAMPVSPGSVGP